MKPTMPLLWLDYQRPPPGRQLPGIGLLIVSLILSALLFGSAVDISTDTALSERQVAKLRQAAERRRLFAPPEASGAPGSSQEPALPVSPSARRWESLLSSLETAGDENVTLLSLTPGGREIVITGEAKGLGEALDYAQRLQAAGALSNAHLAKYEVQREHPRQPVQFTVLSEWREGAP